MLTFFGSYIGAPYGTHDRILLLLHVYGRCSQAPSLTRGQVMYQKSWSRQSSTEFSNLHTCNINTKHIDSRASAITGCA
jgi:hypothetical protein